MTPDDTPQAPGQGDWSGHDQGIPGQSAAAPAGDQESGPGAALEELRARWPGYEFSYHTEHWYSATRPGSSHVIVDVSPAALSAQLDIQNPG